MFSTNRQTDSRDASLCHLRPTQGHSCSRRWWRPPLPRDPIWGRSRTEGSHPRRAPALCPGSSAAPATRYVLTQGPGLVMSCDARKDQASGPLPPAAWLSADARAPWPVSHTNRWKSGEVCGRRTNLQTSLPLLTSPLQLEARCLGKRRTSHPMPPSTFLG